jgi:soluble lytic murein transglycosylase-like protein
MVFRGGDMTGRASTASRGAAGAALIATALLVSACTDGSFVRAPRLAANPEPAAESAGPKVVEKRSRSRFAASATTRARLAVADRERAGRLKPIIARHAKEQGVPFELADAVVRLESRYEPEARNGPNVGLTQINVRTAQSLGFRGPVAGLFDADTNLRYGIKYLATAYKLAKGDTCGTILRYQAGHRAQTMTPAAQAYCGRVKTIIASAG